MKRFVLTMGAFFLIFYAGEIKEAHIPVVYYFNPAGYENGHEQYGVPIPNWYYYWDQTPASIGNHRFHPNLPYDGGYIFGANFVLVGPSAALPDNDFPVEVRAGQDSMTTVYAIDNFGSTLLHENAHKDYYFQYWFPVGGYKPELDIDRDSLRDDTEPGLGFDPNLKDTDGDGYPDFEEYARRHESTWAVGSLKNLDWSFEGTNWPCTWDKYRWPIIPWEFDIVKPYHLKPGDRDENLPPIQVLTLTRVPVKDNKIYWRTEVGSFTYQTETAPWQEGVITVNNPFPLWNLDFGENWVIAKAEFELPPQVISTDPADKEKDNDIYKHTEKKKGLEPLNFQVIFNKAMDTVSVLEAMEVKNKDRDSDVEIKEITWDSDMKTMEVRCYDPVGKYEL